MGSGARATTTFGASVKTRCGTSSGVGTRTGVITDSGGTTWWEMRCGSDPAGGVVARPGCGCVSRAAADLRMLEIMLEITATMTTTIQMMLPRCSTLLHRRRRRCGIGRAGLGASADGRPHVGVGL